MWQTLIVMLIVAAAVVHACARYLPAGWRRRIAAAFSRGGARQSKVADWFAPKAGCGDGCANCGSAAPGEASCAKPEAKTEHRLTFRPRP